MFQALSSVLSLLIGAGILILGNGLIGILMPIRLGAAQISSETTGLIMSAYYAGFMLGTLLCALATTYEMLLVARIVTGLFGGVIGSIVLAIATDLFPLEMRGRVMGYIQTAFAASQVLGLPAGLFFANHWSWHAPFLAIIAVAVTVS